MAYDPRLHHRRSIRLAGYDYTQSGSYFITICTHRRAHLFGTVKSGTMCRNAFGHIVSDEWYRTAEVRGNVVLDAFVVMPNHIHGIIHIVDVNDRRGMARHAPAERQFGHPMADSLPTIVGTFKSAVTKRINRLRKTPSAAVWQRNYWEHIIRDQRALDNIRRYIDENPMRWYNDWFYPK